MRDHVKVFPGRPPFVRHEGKQVCISVHDAWYFAERKKVREAVVATHPDRWVLRGGEWRHPLKADWQKASSAYERFERDEREWYAAYGLVPPNKYSHTAADRCWSTRRAKYGHKGLSEHGAARIAAANRGADLSARWVTRKARHGATGSKRQRAMCRQGHDYATHGRTITVNSKAVRRCWTCYRAAQRRAWKRSGKLRRQLNRRQLNKAVA